MQHKSPNPGSTPLPSHYQAWTWQGSAEPLALTLQSVPMPLLAAGEVLVRNAAIGLNPVDWKVLGGGLTTWQAGHIPGVDGAGEVVAIGPQVSESWLGRRVAYHTSLHGHGSFSEYAPVSARALLVMPDGLGFETAAAVPCPALTAWIALEKLPTRPGQSLLVTGAGGSVGHYLVQLAKCRAFVVTAMANARHQEALKAIGADEWKVGPLPERQSWTDRRCFNAVIDTVSGDHAERMAAALKANGHLVCIQDRVTTWPCAAFGLTLSMHEVALGALHVHGDDLAWRHLTEAGESLLSQVQQGRLLVPAREVRAFDALPQFLDDLRHRRFAGKPVVQLG
ncbi:zinc-binding dehydrogenase [Roseateles sp. SL47]|uniref:zinc-binding dehydrogenase n=1 Tax=Roseateles sp. SL47 TaxID=2995138 RepID=UPI00226F3478|nr:zinc-binding dehydrogenase [Roseateles sp. SL47]WAC70747.1 zinc-binding dehydrogenase [Roseateles sp. SL47]